MINKLYLSFINKQKKQKSKGTFSNCIEKKERKNK